MHRTPARCRSLPGLSRRLPFVLLAGVSLLGCAAAACQELPGTERSQPDHPTADDHVRKKTILSGERWRRVMSDVDAWLGDQPLYSPERVHRIRADLDERVAAISSYELEYLLESLEAKVRLLASPQAREAQEWLGRFLAVMADGKRAQELGDVPDVLQLSAAELAEAIHRVEARRTAVERHRRASLRTHEAFADSIAAGRRLMTADKARWSAVRRRDIPFSPYRGQPVGAPPFPVVAEGLPCLTLGAWGTVVGLDVGGF